MEERILDKDEGRKIKVTRTAVGGIKDVTEDIEGAEDTQSLEEEIYFDIPELDENSDSYDESLVGLTPTQLQKILEERRRAEEEARQERDKLLATANEALREKDFEKAEAHFVQALVYDAECLEAKKGMWLARTHEFEVPEAVYEEQSVRAIENAEPEVLKFLKEHAGGFYAKERETYAAEAKPLSEKVGKAQAERREAFAQNRRYYLIRFLIVLGVAAVFAIGAIVSAFFIVRTQSIIPLVLTGSFGGLCFITLVVFGVYSSKLYTASRYCRQNEKLSSTEDGARLAYLNTRIDVIDYILNEGEEAEEEN